jgi:hypothetical protein
VSTICSEHAKANGISADLSQNYHGRRGSSEAGA